jgi:5-methylcytosine-specific restriction endonuclease McrA
MADEHPSTRVCTDCRAEKPLENFKLVGNGEQRRWQCRPCQGAREKAQLASRRAADGPMPALKCCGTCGIDKDCAKDFKPNPASRWGLSSECRSCSAAREVARRLRKPDAVRATQEAWRLSNLDKTRAYGRASARRRKEKVSAYQKVWRAANADRLRVLAREWGRKNKDKRTAYRHLRRCGDPLDRTYAATLMALQKGKCAACRCTMGRLAEIDHIVPASRGGDNRKSNLQLLCRTCNRSKGVKDALDFMRLKGFLL